MADSKPELGPGRAVLTESFMRCWAPPPTLAPHVACAWAERTGVAQPLLPDAAVELVWSGRGLFVRGADTRPHRADAFPDRTFVAIRFRPGAAADVLALRGTSLRDARVGISELWGRAAMESLETLLASAASPAEAAAVLLAAVRARVTRPPDRAVQAAVVALARPAGPTDAAGLARATGLSERQLRRRCTDLLGYGPKTLHRILRFQRFRMLSRHRRGDCLARLAAAAGYADQSHLTRECIRLAGETPAAHLARIRDGRFLQDGAPALP